VLRTNPGLSDGIPLGFLDAESTAGEHRAAVPANHRRVDAAGDVVATATAMMILGKTFQIQLAGEIPDKPTFSY